MVTGQTRHRGKALVGARFQNLAPTERGAGVDAFLPSFACSAFLSSAQGGEGEGEGEGEGGKKTRERAEHRASGAAGGRARGKE